MQKKIHELQDKVRGFCQMESQLEEKTRRLEASNKERDILEKELIATRSDLAGVKRTLELERQERRDLETRALGLIRDAKRKWENAEKDKISQLNKHIEAQTTKITELCTSNNEMSSRLQRRECELQTANAELDKLRVFQTQYKESLAKTRELNRQSVQGVEIKLEEIAARAHNQLADLRAKLDFEAAKNTDLETRLRNEQDSNHCRESRLNVALELAQNELKDCQEQLRTIQATLPARDAEIETLRKQLQERARQIDDLKTSEQLLTTMQEQLERMNLENEQLKQQLQVTKSDLNETMMNLEQSEALVLNLEQAAQDKATLQKRLQDSLEKEEEQLRKVCNLEELLKRLEYSVTKLEAENATLKQLDEVPAATRAAIIEATDTKVFFGQEETEKLRQQLQTLKEEITVEKQTAKQAQLALWKKEKELSDANLDKRIAVREAKRAEDKIKTLQEEKQRLQEKLSGKAKEEEENSKKLLKELNIAKTSLNDITKEASRNKMQADSAQRALTQANHQIEELQSSSASLRRELDAARKQMRTNQERVDVLSAENRHLTQTIAKHNEEKRELESKIAKLEQDIKGYELNIELLKETCTVLEEQLTDYERLTSDHETRENMLIQDKMKLQKDLEAAEMKVREAHIAQNEEKTRRLVAERNVEQLESETSDIESERNSLITQRDQYKKLAQELTMQVEELTTRCGEMEYDLSEMGRALEGAKAESRLVKEESSEYLTRVHELKEANVELMANLQNSIDQGQELRSRIAELENVLEEMRQFYQEREVKAESTRQQQTKLIDYLQLKLEECSKKKKTVCDKILGMKQKDNVSSVGTGMPVGYRELENQLAKERAKVKTLTDQLLIQKAKTACASAPTSPTTPERDGKKVKSVMETSNSLLRQLSPQRIGHNIPHRFNVGLPMRAGKCAACPEAIQFGRRAATCSECQIMTHLECAVSVPANCGLPTDFPKYCHKSRRDSDESLSSVGDSVQTLAIDQPDKPDVDLQSVPYKANEVSMEGWVKVPGRSKSCWERKYLKLEGPCLCVYEHQPCAGMAPISRLNLIENNGFNVSETVQHPDVMGTAKSDIPFIFRIESNSATTCWPSSRLDIMALSQADKRNWLKALKTVTVQNSCSISKCQKYQTVLRLEKHQLDLNCVVDLGMENVLLLGAKEGLFSYCASKSRTLTTIRGVKQIHQLSLHPHLDLALMIAGEYRELVYCNLRLLKNNALAADCSRPAISTKSVLSISDSCHLYQLQGEILCAATTSHVILLKWRIGEDSGEFIGLRELDTQEPCSCAIFTPSLLIVGCHKFFQIDLHTYSVDEFPEEDNSSIKVALSDAAKLGIFPVCVLNISNICGTAELLLCYNEFGVFVDENGRRTRAVDPVWNHLPFAFAFCKPYLFIVHFSSVEIVKLDTEAYSSSEKNPERTLIELSSPRYLGTAGSKGIYVATVNSYLELLRIDGFANMPTLNGSLTSLDTLGQEDESSSEFSFTSSLMEALDGQGKKVHFAGVHKYIKAALLPMQPSANHTCCTKSVVDLRKPTFGETFPIAVPLNKLYTKTLQVTLWCTEVDKCLGSAQVSLADFSPESPSVKWYNILSFRFMQPSDSPGTSASNGASTSVRQARHDKQESDISVYKSVQNTKEESSDESTIISSQTSTLTRNQGCDELQTAVTLRLEELNCLRSPEEEDEDDGSESGSEDSDEEGIIVEFTMEDNILEDVLEHEEDEELNEETRQTQDKETNTECVFIPEQGKQRKLSAAGVAPGAIHDDKNSIVIKRSQTFSPSAAVSRNHYICRLNRSDSDSSMPLYRRGGPFQRNSVERRSLRWRRPSSALSYKTTKKSSHLPPTARTSLDLELDLQAQHARLNNLQDELSRLRELKQRLEQARERGDTDLATWLLEDQKFQNLIAQAENGKNGKSLEDKKVEKMLKKTSKEIYKLRKTKAGKGKPDIISFKEKMAFFTRVNLNVPVLPPEELGTDNTCPAALHMHRRHASEPVTSIHGLTNSSITRPNSVPGSASPAMKSDNITDRNAANPATIANEDESAISSADGKSMNAKGRPPAEANTQSSENGEREAPLESAEKNGNGEPKRYEYVVDRVLGVEV